MIEICLNPDNQMLGGEVFESVDSDVHADSRDSQEMALRTADKLLKVVNLYSLHAAATICQYALFIQELKPKPGQQMVSFQLLQGMLLLATKNKANIERALQDFMQIAAAEAQGRENVGAILGIATAYQLLKQECQILNEPISNWPHSPMIIKFLIVPIKTDNSYILRRRKEGHNALLGSRCQFPI